MARPRKLGKREKSGRPQRETAADVRYVAGITRGRRMGWPMEASNRIDLIKKAAEPLYGTDPDHDIDAVGYAALASELSGMKSDKIQGDAGEMVYAQRAVEGVEK